MTEQHAKTDGHGNVIVQIIGDGNRVEPGYPHLTLTGHRLRTPRPDHELDWLIPYYRAVPLIGREPELAALTAWRDAGRPLSVRVLTGRGGSGKTRLALALVDAARADGWHAGFVSGEELVRFRAQQNLADWGWQRPTLIVVDYAATHAAALRGWLAELAAREADAAAPLRLLLLERHAEPGSGWWQSVFETGGWDAEDVRALLDPPQPQPLAPLADPEQRRAVLVSLLAGLGSCLTVPEPGTNPDFDRRLAAGDWHGDPLYLLMAGLYGAHAGLIEALALGRLDLAGRLAEHEQARLTRIAISRQLSPELLALLAALATLCTGLPRSAALALAEQTRATLQRGHGGDPAQLCDALHLALPAADGAIAPVLPDLIGEALLLRVLDNSENRPHADGFVEQAWSIAGLPVAVTLIRSVQDFAADGIGRYGERHRPALGWLERLIQDERRSVWELMALANALPEQTVVLRELTASMHRTISERLPEDLDTAPLRATSLNNLANRLSELGQREAALEKAQQAVDLYRTLAAARPEAFTPDLAGSLNNLAMFLSDLGQREAALAAAQQAVDLYRTLAAARPEAFMPNLTGSLNNLAAYLSELGQREAALEAAQQAVDLYRTLAAARPEAFTPVLATSLNNFATFLSELGQREAALTAAQQAVDLRRTLAAARPEAFTPALATSLNNLANRLSELGQREAALAAAQQAVDLYRTLAAARPEAFTPDLAMSLNNLANILSELGQREAALAAAQQAVDLYRTLAAARPEAFTPDLAMSLNNLANRLSELGQREAALAAAQQAVDLRRTLAAARPEAFMPALAGSLNNLANRLSELGQREAALAAVQQAVDLRRTLAAARPEAFTPDLAMSLNNLATYLSELGQREAALAAAQQAVDLYRTLAAAQPEAFTPDLATSLNNLASFLSELGQREAALAAAQQAVDLRRTLAAARPEAFTPALATSLNNLANILSELGQREAALTAAQQAVSLLAPFFLRLPMAYAQWMATMLRGLFKKLEACGQQPDLEALMPILAAFQKLQPSSPDDPGAPS